MNGKCVRSAVAALLLASLLVTGGCSLLPEEEGELTMPVTMPEEISYTTQKVAVGDIVNKISGVCYVAARSRYDLAFTKQGGTLTELEASEGMDVVKGQVLARLDTDSLAADIEKKKIAIEKLKVELEQALDVEEEDNSRQIEKLELQLESLNLGLENLKNQLREATENHEEDSVLADYKTRIDQQRLSIQQVMIDLEELSEEKEEKRNYASEYKQFDLEVAELELKELYSSLSKATIASPINGRVIYVSEEAVMGDYINAQKNIITVADTSELSFEYTGSNASQIKMGMEALITVNGKEYPAEVVQTPSSVPREEFELYKDTVRFKAEEMPEGLALGARAEYEIILEEKRDTLVVPKNAVTKYLGGYYATVLNEDGVRSERNVEVGIESDTQYEILSGLTEGETIIIE